VEKEDRWRIEAGEVWGLRERDAERGRWRGKGGEGGRKGTGEDRGRE